MGRRIATRGALAAAAAAAMIVLGGCSAGLLAAITAATTPTYMPGAYSDGAKWTPCYWTGTTRTDLSGASTDTTHDSYAGAVWLDGSNTIAAGERYDGTKYVPCYWSSGLRTDLAGGSGWTNARAWGRTYDGGTVYSAGYWFDGTQTTPCYWAGTTKTDLTPVVLFSSSGFQDCSVACAVTVANGVVYASGYWFDGSVSIGHACYWVGTTRYDLSGGAGQTFSLGGCIVVSGSTIYVGGNWIEPTTSIYHPCYWVVSGGTTSRVDLPGACTKPGTAFANPAAVNCFAISNGSLYMTGHYADGTKYIPCLWVDGAKTDLPGDSQDGSHVADAGAIVISGSTICIGGKYYTGSRESACYWSIRGGTITRTDLPGDGTHDTE